MQGRKPLKKLIAAALMCWTASSSSGAIATSFYPEWLGHYWQQKPRLQHFPGAWEQIGTGRILHITSDGMRFYTATQHTCSLQTEFDNFRQANKTWRHLRGNAYRGKFSAIPSGGAENLRFTFQRLKKLPSSCINAPAIDDFDPEFIFEHTWHLFNDYYPFFELYNVDWQQQYAQFKPQVTAQTTKAALFQTLAMMLSPLDDGHINLSFEDGDIAADFDPSISLGWLRHYGAIEDIEQENSDDVAIETVDDFNQLLHQQYGQNEANNYSGNTPAQFKQWQGNGEGLPPLVWGVLEGNVGYLQINSMGDNFVAAKEHELVSAKRDRRRINRIMNRVMRELQSTDAMVVDVRFNGGGDDAVAIALANRFADKKRLVFTKRKHQQQTVGDLYQTKRHKQDKTSTVTRIRPHHQGSYTKPVTLITGPDTASAAEIFTLAMRTLPQVTHIGEATQGIHSDILPVALNKNWAVNLSHEIYADALGNVYEGDGIPPTERIAVSSPRALNYGIFPAIDHALNQLGASQALTQEAFDTKVNAIMNTGTLPSFSVAWLSQQGRLEAKAYGYANLEQGIPATINTPYKIGSVSKTLVGISAAQMLERGIINLDTPIAAVLPFSIGHSNQQGKAITLAQLATHTASISDGEAYSCGYYIEADNSSLAAALLGQDCPSPVDIQQSDFLESYLNQQGRLYDAETHFIEVPLGERYHYSNIGTALAAETLAAAANTDFAKWTENNIFQPLGMHNTHWFNADFENAPIKPASRYILDDNAQLTALPEHGLATWADGDLRTSVIDLSTMLLSIIAPEQAGSSRILSDVAINDMLSPQTEHLSDEGEQGLFWTFDDFMLGHDGGDPGVLANMQYSPDLDMGFVFMMNVSGLDTEAEIIVAKQFAALQKLIYQRGLALKAGL